MSEKTLADSPLNLWSRNKVAGSMPTIVTLITLGPLLAMSPIANAQQSIANPTPLPGLKLLKESVLSPDLLQLVPNSLRPLPGTTTAADLPPALLPTVGDLIPMRIVLNLDENSAAVERALRGLGMLSIQRRGALLTGRLPISQVSKLVDIKGIDDVRPAFANVRSGVTKTQGDEAARADFARTLSTLDGSGVTIGVLSDSYDCLGQAATDITNDDLPPAAAVNILDDGFCGTDEGRAMMQIAHDIAPGSDLAFHTAFLGELDFAIGIDELVQAGADIVVDDVFYYEEPFFQDGVIAQAASDAALVSGVTYFTAAGNAGRSSWEGSYASSGQSVISTGDAHDFGTNDTKQTITVSASSLLTVVLQWDDPYSTLDPTSPGPDTDLDIALLNSSGTIVALSADTNIGSDPYEILQYANFGSAQQFDIVIEKQAGPAPSLMKWVGFFGVASIDEYDTASGTVVGHANAESVLSVGAVNYLNTPRYGTSPPQLASYSSGGPAPILFLADGTPTGPITRNNPDFTAPDAGNNTIIGTDIDNDGHPNFFGSSAAVVHAAAVAALLLEYTPSMPPTTVESTLESTAIDHGVAGYNSDSGHGLIDAEAALATVLTPPSITGPLAATTLYGSTVDIDWAQNEFTVDSWQVYLGTTAPVAGVGSSDLYDSGLLGASSSIITATGLPEDDSTIYITLEWSYGNTSNSTTVDAISGVPVQPTVVSPTPGTMAPLTGSTIEATWSAGTTSVDQWSLIVGSNGPLSSNVFSSGALPGTETGITVTGLPLAGETLNFTLEYTVGANTSVLEYVYTANTFTDSITVPPGEWHLLSIPATSTLTFSEFVTGHLDPADFNNLLSPTPWIAFRYDSELQDPNTSLLGTYVMVDLSESLDTLYEGFWLLHLYSQDVNIDLPSDAIHASGVSTSECALGFYCETIPLAYSGGNGGWTIGAIPSNLEPTVDDLRIDTDGTGTICDAGCFLDDADQLGISASTVWTYDPTAANGNGDYVALSSTTPIPAWAGFWVSTTAAGAAGGAEAELPVR